jgi:DNA-binding XRE family transcriptional regulator
MSETVQPEHPWKTKGYLRIHDVMVSPPMLLVSFEDGSVASVETRRLLPPDTEGVDWSRLIFCPYEIGLPSATEIVAIPSSRIRALTDGEYAQQLDAASTELAMNLGVRLRALREQRGRTIKDVAAAAGITAVSLSRIEHGHHGVRLQTAGRILQVLGYTLEDLVIWDNLLANGPFDETREPLEV